MVPISKLQLVVVERREMWNDPNGSTRRWCWKM